jgi:hypothetical protein
MFDRHGCLSSPSAGRLRQYLRTMLLCFAWTLATPIHAQDLARYTNARFAITALVPSHFEKEPPPENGDGATFVGPAGETVLVYGGWNAFGGLEQYMASVRGGLAQVTFEAAGAGWQVVSGYEHSGEIVYHKAIAGKNCRGDKVMGHVRLRYPGPYRVFYDPLVKPIADSLDFALC